MLVLPNPMPESVTGRFYRITGPEGKGKIGKKTLHTWRPEVDTAIYPSYRIEIASMRPGQTMELYATSYWYNPRNSRSKQVMVRPPPEWNPPPSVHTYTPFQILVMIKMKWLPKRTPRHRTEYVSGSPLHSPAPAAPPIHGDIFDHPEDFSPSPGWRSESTEEA